MCHYTTLWNIKEQQIAIVMIYNIIDVLINISIMLNTQNPRFWNDYTPTDVRATHPLHHRWLCLEPCQTYVRRCFRSMTWSSVWRRSGIFPLLSPTSLSPSTLFPLCRQERDVIMNSYVMGKFLVYWIPNWVWCEARFCSVTVSVCYICWWPLCTV